MLVETPPSSFPTKISKLDVSPKPLKHSAPIKMLNTNPFKYPGVNLHAHRRFHHDILRNADFAEF